MPHLALDIARYVALVVLAAIIGRVAFGPFGPVAPDTPADLPGTSGDTRARAFDRHRR
jgi:hypothetical protein